MTTKTKAKFYQWPDGSAAYAYRSQHEPSTFCLEFEFEFSVEELSEKILNRDSFSYIIFLEYLNGEKPVLKRKADCLFTGTSRKKAWGAVEDIDFPVIDLNWNKTKRNRIRGAAWGMKPFILPKGENVEELKSREGLESAVVWREAGPMVSHDLIVREEDLNNWKRSQLEFGDLANLSREELELFRALGLGHPLVNGVESAAEWILENAEK